MCIQKPSFLEVVEALQVLGLEYESDPTKKHPRDPFVLGRVQVNKKYGKKYVVGGLLKAISSQRATKQTLKKPVPEKIRKDKPENPLNLVVRRKKKKDKKQN